MDNIWDNTQGNIWVVDDSVSKINEVVFEVVYGVVYIFILLLLYAWEYC